MISSGSVLGNIFGRRIGLFDRNWKLGPRRTVEINEYNGRMDTDGDLADKAIVGIHVTEEQPPP